MGYCITMRNSKFLIKAKNVNKALQAIKDLEDKAKAVGHFSWVNTEDFTSAQTFGEAMDAFRYPINYADNGDINMISFEGEKLGDDTVLFGAIAPFVESGSFIEMEGEDGSRWRWAFKDGKMKEKSGKVVYDE
jgi:hypothetical protein